MKPRTELKIPSISNESKGRNALRYHGSVLSNNNPYEIRNLKDLSTFTEKIEKWKPDSCKCRIRKPYVAYVDGARFI